MRVGNLKAMLDEYDDNDELIVEFWDRETVTQMVMDTDEGESLTDDQWLRIVKLASQTDEADVDALTQTAQYVLDQENV